MDNKTAQYLVSFPVYSLGIKSYGYKTFKEKTKAQAFADSFKPRRMVEPLEKFENIEQLED